jgi:EAL domain-containing protein (putative c-di-GMP-specific phosphodiesterase class I)
MTTELKDGALREPKYRVAPRPVIALQPIFEVGEESHLWGHEALLRGPDGEGALTVLGRIAAKDRDAFDARCRAEAISLASRLGLRGPLALNVSPTTLCSRRFGMQATMRAAEEAGFPLSRIILEITEREPIEDLAELKRCVTACQNRGIDIALDDFGAGHSGLNTLLVLRPNIIKLDGSLIRGIDEDPRRSALVRGLLPACETMNVRVIAEGVETAAELETLRSLGVQLMQGFYLGRPVLEAGVPSHGRFGFLG